jgi:hypothetical protein
MKYRPPPIPSSSNHMKHSQQSLTDGMPDIHMVESQLSLYSNLSNMTDGMGNKVESEGSKPVTVETAKVVDHSQSGWGGGGLGGGSRHSLMSGLSRIDDSSIDQSIFSELSRKIGNVSTRSMAMSEISAIDMQERDNEDDSSTGFENDVSESRTTNQPTSMQVKKPAALEFDDL